MKKRVLCFGDSNTWGYDPANGQRFSEEIRWTGVLQQQLGADYVVVEEGLNGRTTVFEYRDRPGKCGITYLRPCMDSQGPLDYVILYLGTNDTKVEFDRTPEQIAAGLEQTVLAVYGQGLERPSPSVKLIVVAPTLVHEEHLYGYDEMLGSEAKTRALPALYRKVAEKYGAEFVDLSDKAFPSDKDGVHLDPDTHLILAKVFAEAIQSL